MRWSWIRRALWRRIVVVVVALVLVILSVWPSLHMARAELIPDQNQSGLPSILSGGGGALASLGALIGARQSVESDLSIARSQGVAEDAARVLRAQGWVKGSGVGGADLGPVVSKLRRQTDIEAITGSILQISVIDHNPAFAKAVVTAYVTAIRGRLAAISSDQAAQKKAIAADRLSQSSLNLARAQDALDRFRSSNRLAEPRIELGAAISLVTSLQAQLQAKQAALSTLQRFATDNNVQVQALSSDVQGIKAQLQAAQAQTNSMGPSVGGMTPIISQYENLYRNEVYAQAEYEIYKRYLDTVTVELLSSDINMSLIAPPYLDPDRQLNKHMVIALVLWLMLAVLAEFYVVRPPPGWRRREAV